MAITISITSGNAQLVPANRGVGSKPIIINVQNGGVNVAGATVAITAVLAGSGAVTPPLTSRTPVTDANGNATVQFVPGTQVAGSQQVMEYDFTASYGGVTATFIEIGYYMSPQNLPGASASRVLPAPSALTPYVVSAAGAAGTPIKINVYRTDTLAGIPNVGCRIIPVNDGTGGTQQTITSAEGTGPENLVLTDASGNATMTPTFAVASSAMSAVSQTFIVDFGKFGYFGPFSYTVGAPVTPVPQPTTVIPAASPFAAQRPTAHDIDQIQSRVRQGAGGQLLTSDGTGQPGNLPQYATDRSATDSGVAAASVVTSVTLSIPPEFSITGSPSSGHLAALAISKMNQAANQVYAGPSSGGAAAPGFRALVAADLPGLTVVITTAKLTTGGANGSMTFTNGLLTAQVAAT